MRCDTNVRIHANDTNEEIFIRVIRSHSCIGVVLAPRFCEVRSKALSLLDRPARYQLVGKVKAYQGYGA